MAASYTVAGEKEDSTSLVNQMFLVAYAGGHDVVPSCGRTSIVQSPFGWVHVMDGQLAGVDASVTVQVDVVPRSVPAMLFPGMVTVHPVAGHGTSCVMPKSPAAVVVKLNTFCGPANVAMGPYIPAEKSTMPAIFE